MTNESNQVVYKINHNFEDSDSDDEVITIEQSNNVLSKNVIFDLQRVINDTTINDIDEIIDILKNMINQNPSNGDLNKNLNDAMNYKLQQSINNRHKLIIKKNIDNNQFPDHIKLEYNKTEPDSQYKILTQSRDHYSYESKNFKPIDKPAPKNWGTKTIFDLSTVKNSEKSKSPLEWLIK